MNNPVPLEYATSFSQTRQAMMQQFATGLLTSGDNATDFMRYSELASVQQNYLLEMGALWMDSLMGSDPEQPAKGDRRFAGEEWKKSPYHEFLKQSYLVNARYVGDLIERASLDDRTRARMHFFARQILDVLSPSNHLTTNPQVIRRAMETGGDSLATGVKNLLEDLGKGRISMTDEQAFEVGRNLALTPGSVVFENELIQLIQYQPLTEAVGKRPLVLFPPSINKFYVFDLQPANSFICYAVEQGNTVFVVSWRNVMAEQGHLTWDDYFNEGIMRAIDVALEITGADKVNALGFCVGGTMLGCAAAVMAARREDKIESLTFLTTMLDFTQAGEIALLIDEQSVAAREQTIDGGGILPGRELAFVFSTLRGNDLIWPYVVGNYLEGRQPDAFDILYWNADSTNLPGPMYCWYVRNTYLENNLRGPGQTTQCGVRVDLSAIDVPTCAGESRGSHRAVEDRLPNHATGVGRRAFRARSERSHRRRHQPGSAQQAQLLGRRRAGKTTRALAGYGARRAGKLVAGLERLASFHAGKQVRARTRLGSTAFPEIETPPGRYVTVRAA